MNGHAPDADAATQGIFDQGHEVVDLAKSLYAGGIEVNAGTTAFQQIIRASLEAARARKPISEAALVYDDGFARANVLNAVGKDAWEPSEVKSSTEIKDVNVLDLAFQVKFSITGGIDRNVKDAINENLIWYGRAQS